MMELIEQKFVKINFIFLMLLILNSCQTEVQDGKLECVLDNIKVDLDEVEIEVGQHDGWTDTSALILITFHKKSLNIPIGGNLKGVYKGRDIYFYQTTIDSLDTKKYSQIPNDIRWKSFTPKELDEDIIQPPYNPVNIQIEYNRKKNCFERVIRGKGFISESISKCSCREVEELISE